MKGFSSSQKWALPMEVKELSFNSSLVSTKRIAKWSQKAGALATDFADIVSQATEKAEAALAGDGTSPFDEVVDKLAHSNKAPREKAKRVPGQLSSSQDDDLSSGVKDASAPFTGVLEKFSIERRSGQPSEPQNDTSSKGVEDASSSIATQLEGMVEKFSAQWMGQPKGSTKGSKEEHERGSAGAARPEEATDSMYPASIGTSNPPRLEGSRRPRLQLDASAISSSSSSTGAGSSAASKSKKSANEPSRFGDPWVVVELPKTKPGMVTRPQSPASLKAAAAAAAVSAVAATLPSSPHRPPGGADLLSAAGGSQTAKAATGHVAGAAVRPDREQSGNEAESTEASPPRCGATLLEAWQWCRSARCCQALTARAYAQVPQEDSAAAS